MRMQMRGSASQVRPAAMGHGISPGARKPWACGRRRVVVVVVQASEFGVRKSDGRTDGRMAIRQLHSSRACHGSLAIGSMTSGLRMPQRRRRALVRRWVRGLCGRTYTRMSVKKKPGLEPCDVCRTLRCGRKTQSLHSRSFIHSFSSIIHLVFFFASLLFWYPFGRGEDFYDTSKSYIYILHLHDLDLIGITFTTTTT